MNITTTPLVSIIIPVYNVEEYVHQCLESIRQQSYCNLEIIIVEDCSTDKSLSILESHLSDNRVVLIRHEQNSGLSAARNTGIKAATGEYLAFVDSDDIVNTNLILCCVQSAIIHSADVVTYNFTTFKDVSSIHFENINTESLFNGSQKLGINYFDLPHFAWLKFVRSELLKNNKLQFPVGLFYEDWPFHWQLGLLTKNIYNINYDLYYYRQRGTSITGSIDRKLLDLYKVQNIVVDTIFNIKDNKVKVMLVNKLLDSHWSILTRIEDIIMHEAYNEASMLLKKTKKLKIRPTINTRRFVVLLAIMLPESIGIKLLNFIRKILNLRTKL